MDNSIPKCVEAQRAAPPAGGIAYTAVGDKEIYSLRFRMCS